MSMQFKKAERKQVKLKLGLAGPSGSGKTFSALRIAKGLLDAAGNSNGRIALIDTENKSASLYADTKGMPAFDALEIEPPFTVDKYIDAIELAIHDKYDVLIVDSVSHLWSGEGGLLQEKEALDARGGNSYTNWAKMTPKWNRFVSGILHSDVHMICTMRSKQDYVLETNEKGKQAPKKVGMAPQVREGFEYELTAVFDMDMAHQAKASKDRTSLFDDRIWRPDDKTGSEIWTWLQHGKTPEKAPLKSVQSPPPNILKERVDALAGVVNPVAWPKGMVLEYCENAYGKKLADISEDQFHELLKIVEKKSQAVPYVAEKPAPSWQDETTGPIIQPKSREPGEEG